MYRRNNMFDIEKLTTPAKYEALRAGNTAVMNQHEVIPFMEELTPYLVEGDSFSMKPLGEMAGTIHMYAVKVVPTIKVKQPH
jgi:uncharacterized protein YfdQ (DUF2303 family)